MKQFLAFVHKEFLYIIRDSRTLLILIAMPVVQVLLFGFALRTDVDNVSLVILDHSRDDVTRRLTQSLENNPYFTVLTSSLSDREFEDLLRAGKVDAGLIYPSGFQGRLYRGEHPAIQLIVDGSHTTHASIIESYVMASLYQSLPMKGAASASVLPYDIDVVNRLLFNPTARSTYNFVPGVIGLVLIIICSIMTSVSIVREREYGSLDVIRVSPFGTNGIVFAKVVPYAFISLFNFLSIVLLSYYVLMVPMRGSFWLLLLLSFIYILLSLAIGMCVSVFVGTQSNAIIITGIGLILPTMLLSGMLFPIGSMPEALQWLSYAVPARWYIDGMRQVMIQGAGLRVIWLDMVVLIGMTGAILSLTLWHMNRKLS